MLIYKLHIHFISDLENKNNEIQLVTSNASLCQVLPPFINLAKSKDIGTLNYISG